MVVKTTAGAMFYFHVSMATHNCSTHEEVCRDLGYDGFAVVSAPEAFVYALKFTDYVRNRLDTPLFVGAHFRSVPKVTLWDDGTPLRSDTPFGHYPPRGDSSAACAQITTKNFELSMMGTTKNLPALCGNHKNYPTDSSGTTLSGELQTSVKTVLSVSQVFSYLECAVICGTVHECRAAEFNPDLLTCTVIGKYTSSGHNANPQVVTYIRKTF
ncbi:hypothetical protein RRG08_066324 [Elysia crispata]|uniref:Apple domain-containing protein n=1 Tax=Elysia crispata TaxID=231223 RepID=A0AAE1DIJ3_9GAST|nr:hypothetical protein RRG08_066324 [Elysia crispata]